MYQDGQGVTQDYAEAAKWFRLAAAQGDTTAQLNLGMMYVDGKSFTQNYAEAAKWFRLAAAQGNATAQYNLGRMYAIGQGVTQDYVRAHMWFNLAGASGNVSGVEGRGFISERMTPQQIAEAQKMAWECQQHNFKGCD